MRNFALRVLCASLVTLTCTIAPAADSVRAAANPQLEQRALKLSEELRCLVCQNQTLAESHAELAVDLKNLLRSKLEQGLSDRQVIDFLVERYGDFVLYRPPVKAITWLLWFGPFALLLLGIGWLVRRIRRRPLATAASASELQRAADLLDEPGKNP